MLRIGLTGDLGSGKSTVARIFAERGAIILSSDDIGRALMQPGQPVYEQIVAHFGPEILSPDNTLDRRKLAALAFSPQHPRVEELNAIVHPAVIAAQAEQLAALPPDAIAIIESALIFSTQHAGSWHNRFERILLVTAPEETKIARFIDRIAAGRTLSAAEHAALETDARHRLSLQHSADYASQCTVLHNDGDIEQLEAQVDAIWHVLQESK